MYRVDMSQRPADILRGLVNFDNGTNFTARTMTFNEDGASPLSKRDAKKYDRNSRIRADFHGEYSGSQIFNYNRIDLNHFYGNITAGAPHGAHREYVELLPYVKKDLGIDLAPEDILNEYIDPEANYCDIEILRDSVAYIGSVRVYLQGSPGSLVDKVRETTLRGFTLDNI